MMELSRPTRLFNGLPLFVNPNSRVAQAAKDAVDPYEKRVFTWLATKPTAIWYGGWPGALDSVHDAVSAANRQNQVINVVLYNTPKPDGSGYAEYPEWRDAVADVVGNWPCVWIVEPDALAALDSLSADEQQRRLEWIADTGKTLKQQSNSWVYLDAGNYSEYLNPLVMADRLERAGVDAVNGFAANVSGFGWQEQMEVWCANLSTLLGGKHFVMDTSTNGAGPWANPAGPQPDDWCNPPGRKVGLSPQVGPSWNCDAHLWVKPVGESDGVCRGGPPAREWYPAYALELARDMFGPRGMGFIG